MKKSYLYGLGGPRRIGNDEIVRLYLSGMDSDLVGIQAGCCGTTVLTLVKRAGGTVRGRAGRPADAQRKLSDAEIVKGYCAGGLSGVELSDQAECSKATIYTVLKRHGVARRPKGGRK